MEEPKCTLSDEELIEKSLNIIDSLCKTGGKSWCLSVPVDFSKDPDILFNELCIRLKEVNNKYPTETGKAIGCAIIKHNHSTQETVLKNFRNICGSLNKGKCIIDGKKCTFNNCEALKDLFKE